MTALLLTACVGMITGAFLIFRISPMDFTLGVFRRLTAGPKSIRDEINETTHRKKPARIHEPAPGPSRSTDSSSHIEPKWLST